MAIEERAGKIVESSEFDGVLETIGEISLTLSNNDIKVEDLKSELSDLRQADDLTGVDDRVRKLLRDGNVDKNNIELILGKAHKIQELSLQIEEKFLGSLNQSEISLVWDNVNRLNKGRVAFGGDCCSQYSAALKECVKRAGIGFC